MNETRHLQLVGMLYYTHRGSILHLLGSSTLGLAYHIPLCTCEAPTNHAIDINTVSPDFIGLL